MTAQSGVSHLDINPDSLFLTKDGFKTYHPLILESEDDNIERALGKLRNHSAPEVIKDLDKISLQKKGLLAGDPTSNSLSSVYSLGLTILDCATLDVTDDFYTQ